MEYYLREAFCFPAGGLPVTGSDGDYGVLPGWTAGPVYAVIGERNASSEDSRLDLADIRRMSACHLGELGHDSETAFVYEDEGAAVEFRGGHRLLLRLAGLPGGFDALDAAWRDTGRF